MTDPAHPLHPGLLLAAELRDRHIVPAEFGRQLGHNITWINNLLAGRGCHLSSQLSARISAILGTPPRYWFELQFQYDRWHERALQAIPPLDKVPPPATE